MYYKPKNKYQRRADMTLDKDFLIEVWVVYHLG